MSNDKFEPRQKLKTKLNFEKGANNLQETAAKK